MFLRGLGAQDPAAVLSKSPNRENVPVLGVADRAVSAEDSNDLLLYVTQKPFNSLENRATMNDNCQVPVGSKQARTTYFKFGGDNTYRFFMKVSMQEIITIYSDLLAEETPHPVIVG